jgi:SnoaL-like domain
MSRDLVDSWFEAFREKDISKLILSEDFIHSSPFGEINGREAYLELIKKNPDAFFSPIIEIVDVVDGGDRFAVRYLVNGNPACDCIYGDGSQITRIYSYYHYGDKPSF